MQVSQTNPGWDVLLDLTGSTGTLHERLTVALRTAIRSGQLVHGRALPPSRVLADELGLSRWTVTRAYGQLSAECYLEARTGSATRVRWVPEPADRATSTRPPSVLRYDLRHGRPDLRAFPRRRWAQAVSTATQTASYDELDYPAPGGAPQLRSVLSAYLNRVRGAATDPASVHVCFGAGQAMLRICSALKDGGHTAIAVEDPGPTRLWQAAQLAGLELVPLSVDDEGLVVDELASHPSVRAVLVGAAHQCPTGPALAPPRRAALLEWARRVDGLVIEDDYDAEFRYDRPATATLQGMEPRRVALIGSVSKTLGPAVGIGWAVAPARWAATLRADDQLLLMPPALNQLALAWLMESGSYDRHLRAARSRFRVRRDLLLEALDTLPGCRVRAAEAGLHVILELPPGSDAAAVSVAVRRQGLGTCPLDEFRLRPDLEARPALVLGYAALADHAVADAVHVLASCLSAG